MDQFTLLFMILFLICVYYLFRINECSNKFNHLRNSFSKNIQDNIFLSNSVDKYQEYNNDVLEKFYSPICTNNNKPCLHDAPGNNTCYAKYPDGGCPAGTSLEGGGGG